jgi:hypothetical protein
VLDVVPTGQANDARGARHQKIKEIKSSAFDQKKPLLGLNQKQTPGVLTISLEY